jgi:ABC-type iron transport system FetAB permease component
MPKAARNFMYFFIFCFLVWLVAQLCHIHSKDLINEDNLSPENIPSILGLLQTEYFMSFVFVVTIGIYVLIAAILWNFHEIPLHRVEKSNPLLMKVVFGLGMCGILFDKHYWVVALVIAFMPWQWVADHVSHMIWRGVSGNLPDLSLDDKRLEGHNPFVAKDAPNKNNDSAE